MTTPLLKVADDVERRTPAKDEATRAKIAAARAALKDPAATPASVTAAAEQLAALQPDVESVHVVVLDALIALAGREDVALRQRIRVRAMEFVERNPTVTAGHLALAAALAAQGDEEGQLRALAACGERCRALFLSAAQRWQRVRCVGSGSGIASGLQLRYGAQVLADADHVAFLEPIAGVPAVAGTHSTPAVAEKPAQCLVQLKPRQSARLAQVPSTDTTGLFILNGIALVSDALTLGAAPGSVLGPPVVCERLCKNPMPRPLPPGVSTPAP